MDWLELLYEIFDVCIIPLLGLLTVKLVAYIKAKGDQLAIDADNALGEKYIKMLTQTITDCVIATNQTFVNYLKDQGKFDLEAQKKAFELTYNSVLAILTEDAKEYLSNIYGDLTIYLTKKIEAEVNSNKT